MLIHQNCYNEYYTINYYKDYIEIEISFIPINKFNRSKMFFDLVLYYKISNTIIKFNGKIFYNEDELGKFFGI